MFMDCLLSICLSYIRTDSLFIYHVFLFVDVEYLWIFGLIAEWLLVAYSGIV